MKLKKIIIIIILILIIFLMFFLLLPKIKIDKTTINYNSKITYKVSATNFFGDITKYLKVSDNINNKVLGSYQVKVKINYLFYHYSKSFTIKVIDDCKPTISLIGNNPSYVCPSKEYIEEGYKAIDDYDGDITDKVNIIKKDNYIIYSVLDSSSNKEEIKRNIIFDDKDAPSITLTGGNSIVVYKDTKYNEKGYMATDKCDGDITDKVVITGEVNTSKIGEYQLEYKVVDNSGNSTSVKRIVVVKEKPVSTSGFIYLTFDDGPSYLTGKILDILAEEDVKATFFVTNGNSYVKRAYDSGHTIALHTSSHNYSYIYLNETNYFRDLNKVSDSVYNTIGIRPKFIRFPGGSSNTVSRRYNKGIMTKLIKSVTNQGYIYFDWNVDSNDAGSDLKNSNKIYNNVIKGLSHKKTNVVLMHDSASHIATVNALKKIIEYGKNNGYSYKAITDDTPVIRHRVNN